MQKKVYIEGMSCQHCVRHATEALAELKGASNVQVNLEDKMATLELDPSVTDEMIKEAIQEVGYQVTGIESL